MSDFENENDYESEPEPDYEPEPEPIKIVLPKKRVMTEKQLLALKKGREKSHARGLLRNKKIEIPPNVIAPQKSKRELRQEELERLKEEQEHELEKLKIMNEYNNQKQKYNKKTIEPESESEYETDSDNETYDQNKMSAFFG